MTNKEAKEIMSKVTFYWELGEQTLTQNQINEALEMALEALEQEPCDDAISRADAKKYLSAPNEDGDRVIYEDDLDLLPSVTPQQKIGQWEVDEDCIYTCNQCNKRNLWHSLFCPNCGAKMEGDIK